jgi:hypothetical protein
VQLLLKALHNTFYLRIYVFHITLRLSAIDKFQVDDENIHSTLLYIYWTPVTCPALTPQSLSVPRNYHHHHHHHGYNMRGAKKLLLAYEEWKCFMHRSRRKFGVLFHQTRFKCQINRLLCTWLFRNDNYRTLCIFLCVKDNDKEVAPVLNEVPHHDEVWRTGCTAPRALNLGTRWSEWSASRLSRFNPREGVPETHWIGGWTGPRTGLEAVAKREDPCPFRK